MTLCVIAHVHARPECAAEIAEHLRAAIEPTRREAGCIRYDLLTDNEVPGHFVFVEEWADDAALAEHLGTAHIAALRSAIEPMLAGPATLHRMRLVD
ncbi:MAG: antibiotic biosynthesis monooxygenase [Actinomycetales bacterium]|nr:antibiotic biosynthesis monooxygenase [Actinomycetales bacterium]